MREVGILLVGFGGTFLFYAALAYWFLYDNPKGQELTRRPLKDWEPSGNSVTENVLVPGFVWAAKVRRIALSIGLALMVSGVVVLVLV